MMRKLSPSPSSPPLKGGEKTFNPSPFKGKGAGVRVIIALLFFLSLAGTAFAGPLDDQLVSAAKAGNAAEVKALLRKGANVNARDKDGATALLKAVVNGRRPVVSLLIARGADVNAKDNQGSTPLMGAAFNGHVDLLRVLIAKGADPNAKTRDGETALTYAALMGSTCAARDLLAHKADVNAHNNDGVTALMSAAYAGHKDVVSLLLEKGANPNLKAHGKTAMDFAREKHFEEIVNMLIKVSIKK